MTVLAKRVATAWICGVALASPSVSEGGATCPPEAVAEVEPNGSFAAADAAATATTGAVQITGSTWIRGAIMPALDQD